MHGRNVLVAVDGAQELLRSIRFIERLRASGMLVRHIQEDESALAEPDTVDIVMMLTNTRDKPVQRIARMRQGGLIAGLAALVKGDLEGIEADLLHAGADVVFDAQSSADTMVNRLQALTRRVRGEWTTVASCRLQGTEMEHTNRTVHAGAQSVQVSPTDFRLLVYLGQQAERWASERKILRDVFATHHAPGTSIVRVHICSLRKALRSMPLVIEQRRGVGWRLVSHTQSLVELKAWEKMQRG